VPQVGTLLTISQGHPHPRLINCSGLRLRLRRRFGGSGRPHQQKRPAAAETLGQLGRPHQRKRSNAAEALGQLGRLHQHKPSNAAETLGQLGRLHQPASARGAETRPRDGVPVQNQVRQRGHLRRHLQPQRYAPISPLRNVKRLVAGKKFVVRNSALYVCDGTISETTGSCSGNLKRATFKTKKDFCYANVNSVINNWYCVGGGSVSAGIVNGNVFCNSNDGSPTLLISSDEYKNLCADVATSATYKYFTQQKLGEHGSDVQCSEGLPQVCTMSENLTGNFAGVSYVTIN
jgi:hypothetical protein